MCSSDLFGPTSPAVFGHLGNRNLRAGACSPCFTPTEAGCQEAVCMREITPSMVIDATLAVLGVPHMSKLDESPKFESQL